MMFYTYLFTGLFCPLYCRLFKRYIYDLFLLASPDRKYLGYKKSFIKICGLTYEWNSFEYNPLTSDQTHDLYLMEDVYIFCSILWHYYVRKKVLCNYINNNVVLGMWPVITWNYWNLLKYCVNSADIVTPMDNFNSNMVAAIREVVYIQTFGNWELLKVVNMKIVFFVNPNVKAFLYW